jgi:hypothetical protein
MGFHHGQRIAKIEIEMGILRQQRKTLMETVRSRSSIRGSRIEARKALLGIGVELKAFEAELKWLEGQR